MRPLNLKPGDKVAVIEPLNNRIVPVARVLKSSVILEDGTKWSLNGDPIPKRGRWDQRIEADVDSARRMFAIRILQRLCWDGFTTEQLETAAEALTPGSTLR